MAHYPWGQRLQMLKRQLEVVEMVAFLALINGKLSSSLAYQQVVPHPYLSACFANPPLGEDSVFARFVLNRDGLRKE
jgi:hypothetical protein